MGSKQNNARKAINKNRDISIIGEIYLDIKYMPMRGYINKYVI